MSSSAPSSSQSQRTPLHERSNSEKNKLQIRLVPYSPPRAEHEDEEQAGAGTGAGAEAEGSGTQHNQDQETNPKAGTSYHDYQDYYDTHRSSHRSRHTRDQSTGATWTRSRTPLAEEDYDFDNSYDPSASSTPVWPRRTRAVSGSRPSPASSGNEPSTPTPKNPAYNRPLLAKSRRLSEPVQYSRNQNATPSPTRQRPRSRQSRVINVRSDGTFSVDVKPPQQSDRTASSLISGPSYTSTFTSRERGSFGTASAQIPSSPPSSAPERGVSPYASSSLTYTEDPKRPATASFWDYPMVGGLRKVPKTPDLKSQQRGRSRSKEGSVSSTSLPPLPEAVIAPPEASGHISKPSFNSGHSTSTDATDSSSDETANFRVIGHSSPAGHDADNLDSTSLPSLPSSEPNYRIIQESSPAPPFASSPGPEYLDTPVSRNLVVHATTPSTVATTSRRPRPQYSNDSLSEHIRDQYSQESLVIPPLIPRKRSSLERFGYYRQISRESSLRGRANSFSSISSIISQDTASLLVSAAPNLVRLNRSPSASSVQAPTWVGQSGPVSHRTRMEPAPHPWNAQLSPVASEYEGSEYSRLATAASRSGSSALGSRHSRQLLSMPSSPVQEEALQSSESLEPPSSAYMRGGLPSPAVRHLDEHGDGLADLQQHQLQHKRSWSRTGGHLSRRGSDRELHSSASSRAGSLTAAALPTWARLYYGSGERRWLMRNPSMQSLAESSPSRPGSSFATGSPAEDHGPSNIWNPRRRPRTAPAQDDQEASVEGMSTTEGVEVLRLGPKKKTSSVWSPHLRFDRRAIRYSIFEPPSMPWTPEGGMFGLVNIQVLLFAVGFGLPLAWMVASFLPLPPKPVTEMFERDGSATGLGIGAQQAENLDQRVAPIDDTRYQNARWWRNLNRVMSIVGLLIIGAIIALVVVGTRQGWGQS